MSTKYFIDGQGNYLGAFCGAIPDVDATEVPLPTTNGMQKFIDGKWSEIPLTNSDRKLIGVEFNGVMCSATKEDMWGLNAVKEWVVSGNTTNFEFDNGNVLELTPENYADFEDVWVPFRASFF